MQEKRRGVESPKRGWRGVLHEVIFEADTFAGELFDILLIICIVLSVLGVMLESISGFRTRFGTALMRLEWFFTILFTIEYMFRLISVRKPWRYATSFWGVVDLLGFLPTYLARFVPGSSVLRVVRVLRVLRVFRVLRLTPYMSASSLLKQALISSQRKITVFLVAVMTLVVILGSLMYMIEGEASGFTSIPQSIYWAIVTLTTVGYGDLSPDTPLGKALASVIMIVGYGIIAVPTGIVTAERVHSSYKETSTQACPACSAEGHDKDARFCKLCGSGL
jgi:voltage-gated potassium channel